MGLRLTPTGGGDDVDAAMALAQAARDAAAAAQEKGDEAVRMIRNDRERNAMSLDELRAAAAQLPTTQQAAAEAHLALQEQLDTLRDLINTDAAANDETQQQLDSLTQRVDNIELIPGPPGVAGKDGSPGKSAYLLARDAGYGGTETQWLASLKGADGATGAAGKDGVTPTLTIGTVTTGAAGSNAAASFSGTAAAPVLNLTIPRGATGSAGNAGTANLAVGIRPTPALGLLSSIDVTIPLSKDMGGTTYSYQYATTFDQTAAMQVTFKSRTSSSITFTCKALVALGSGFISVVAW